MDRSAVLIDAGYLLAEGGKLVGGSGSRIRLDCDFGALVEEIAAFCRGIAAPVLRTYWYDAAVDSIPTADQLLVARLPFVKLRLGRLAGGEQKGVDSLIVRDLMVLASTRAVHTAFVLGGDEDLREGVVYAQDLGVQVVLVGVPPLGRANQADTLIREADLTVDLPTDLLKRHLRVKAPFPSRTPGGRGAVEERAKATAIGFAAQWAQRATQDELRDLLGSKPQVPAPLDRELLFAVQAEVGRLDERDEVRRLIRDAFWAEIAHRAAGASGTAAE